MEAAGVIQATEILKFSNTIYIIKAITDQESEESSNTQQASDFVNNFELAMKNLCQFILETVKVIKEDF